MTSFSCWIFQLVMREIWGSVQIFLFPFYFHITACRPLLENLHIMTMRKKSSIDDSYFCRGIAICIRGKHLRCVKLQSMYSEICHVSYPLFMGNSAYCRNNNAAGLIKPIASEYVKICDVMIFSYTSSAKHEDKLY